MINSLTSRLVVMVVVALCDWQQPVVVDGCGCSRCSSGCSVIAVVSKMRSIDQTVGLGGLCEPTFA